MAMLPVNVTKDIESNLPQRSLQFISGQSLSLLQPKVMGILNITPDSFSTVGRYLSPREALKYAKQMVADGAAIIDIGAEATNPQLTPNLTLDEELHRLLPVLELLQGEIPLPISVDTSKPEVMYEAVQLGASMINDVRALTRPGALAMAAQLQTVVCLMHMGYPDGKPESLNDLTKDNEIDIVTTIKAFLSERITACLNAGIRREHIIIDPGIGHGNFGKNLKQNLRLLAHLADLQTFDLPILVGLSRKTFIGEVLDVSSEERVFGSIASAVMAVERGASLIRVHDVKATVQAIQLLTAIMSEAN